MDCTDEGIKDTASDALPTDVSLPKEAGKSGVLLASGDELETDR